MKTAECYVKRMWTMKIKNLETNTNRCIKFCKDQQMNLQVYGGIMYYVVTTDMSWPLMWPSAGW